MKRRGFLGMLAGVITAVIARPAMASAVPKNGGLVWLKEGHPYPQRFQATYRGYGIFWTGWKESAFCVDLYGQWVAWPLDFGADRGFYSSFPGRPAILIRGENFDVSFDDEQLAITRDITWTAQEDRKERAKSLTLHRLLDLIDKQGEA